MTKRIWTRILFAGLLCMAAAPAFGSGGVAVGSLIPLSQEDLGRTVTVLDRPAIESAHAPTAAELLRMVPGLRVVQKGALGQPAEIYIRGCEASFTGVALDGVFLNDSFNAQFDLSRMAADNIERIEIVRGPLGVAGGMYAAGGVINIITRRGGSEKESDALAEGGTHTELRGRLRTRGMFEDYAYSLSASRLRTDGHLPVNNAFDLTTLWGSLSREFSEKKSIAATAWLAFSDREDPYDNGGDARPPYALDPGARFDETSLAVVVQGAAEVAEWWDLSFRLGAFGSRQDLRDPDNGPALDPAGGRSRRQDVRRESLRVVNTMPAPWGWRFDWGGEFWEERARQRSGGVKTQELSRHNWGGFFELAKGGEGFGQGDRWKVDFGLRYDCISEGKEWQGYAFNGVYIWQGARIHGSINQGHRLLTVGEVGMATPVYTPDDGLDTPKLFSWELGAGRRFFDRLDAEVTVFYCEQENFVETIPGDRGGTTHANGPEAEVRGLEILLGFDATEHLRFEADWMFQDNEISSAGHALAIPLSDVGRGLDRRPDTMGSARVVYHDEKRRAELTARYFGPSNDQDYSPLDAVPAGAPRRARNDGYTVVDAVLQYRVNADLLVYARGENILDEEYEEAYGFTRPGAAIRAGLVYTF